MNLKKKGGIVRSGGRVGFTKTQQSEIVKWVAFELMNRLKRQEKEARRYRTVDHKWTEALALTLFARKAGRHTLLNYRGRSHSHAGTHAQKMKSKNKWEQITCFQIQRHSLKLWQNMQRDAGHAGILSEILKLLVCLFK